MAKGEFGTNIKLPGLYRNKRNEELREFWFAIKVPAKGPAYWDVAYKDPKTDCFFYLPMELLDQNWQLVEELHFDEDLDSEPEQHY